MQVHKIVIPTPYEVGDVNAFLVKGDALTLFDAGPKTEEAYEALKWGIRAAGYEMKDVEQVILTHHHPDHAGWVDAFPNAAVLAHEYVDHWMRQTEEFLAYRNNFYIQELAVQGVPQKYIEEIVEVRGEIELFGTTPLTQYLKEGDEVPGHPGLRVYETPGHAQSHLIFIEENTLRIDYAEQYLIHNKGAKQTDIAAACGFPNASSFNNIFKKITGVTPKIWLATRS